MNIKIGNVSKVYSLISEGILSYLCSIYRVHCNCKGAFGTKQTEERTPKAPFLGLLYNSNVICRQNTSPTLPSPHCAKVILNFQSYQCRINVRDGAWFMRLYRTGAQTMCEVITKLDNK